MKLDKMSDVFAGKVDVVKETEIDYSVDKEFSKSTPNYFNGNTNLFGSKVSGLDSSILKNKLSPKNMTLPKGYFSSNTKNSGLPKAYFGGMGATKVSAPKDNFNKLYFGNTGNTKTNIPKDYFSMSNKGNGLPKGYFNTGNTSTRTSKDNFPKLSFGSISTKTSVGNFPQSFFSTTSKKGNGLPKDYFNTSNKGVGLPKDYFNTPKNTGLPKDYFNVSNTKSANTLKNNVSSPMNFKGAGNNFEAMMRGVAVRRPDKIASNRIRQQSKLNPMGDFDNDKLINMLDCDPFNRKKQGENDEMTDSMQDGSAEDTMTAPTEDEGARESASENLEEDIKEKIGVGEKEESEESSEGATNNNYNPEEELSGVGIDYSDIDVKRSPTTVSVSYQKEQYVEDPTIRLAKEKARNKLADIYAKKLVESEREKSLSKTQRFIRGVDTFAENLEAGRKALGKMALSEKTQERMWNVYPSSDLGNLTGTTSQIVYKEEFKNVGTKKNPRWEKVKVPTTERTSAPGTIGVTQMSGLGSTGAGLSLGNLNSTGQGFSMMTSQPVQGQGFMSMIPGMGQQPLTQQPVARIPGEPQALRQIVPLQQAQAGTNPQEVIISPFSKRPVTYTRGPYRKQQVQQYQQG